MAAHVSRRTYLRVFGALLLLTFATIQAAFLDLGALGTPVALAIAAVKATLVVMYFMHARYSPPLTRLAFFGGLYWLLILFGLTMADYLTRMWRTFG